MNKGKFGGFFSFVDDNLIRLEVVALVIFSLL